MAAAQAQAQMEGNIQQQAMGQQAAAQFMQAAAMKDLEENDGAEVAAMLKQMGGM